MIDLNETVNGARGARQPNRNAVLRGGGLGSRLVWLAALVVGCGSTNAPGPSSSDPASGDASDIPTGAMGWPSVGSVAWRGLSAARRAERIQLLQASAGPEFGLRESEPGMLSARHDGMGFRTTFERGRVSVETDGLGKAAAPIQLGVAAWGCEGALRDVPSSEPTGAAHTGGVSYAHDGFDEWYTLGPAGLEQGFTIRTLPACARRGDKLQIKLRFSELEGSLARISPDGSEAVLTTPGRAALHYSDPFAKDASGRETEVVIVGASETGSALTLEVDTRNVTLPLLVDPLIWGERQRPLASDFIPASFSENDFFGTAIAVSGDTLAVGTPGDRTKGIDAGAVYVFIRVPSLPTAAYSMRWGPQQKLTASDGAVGDHFGGAVAVVGDTLLVGAFGDDDKGLDSGAAYVYTRAGNVWTEQQKLVPSDLLQNSQFGFSVAMTADSALVGAPLQGATGKPELGAVYGFGKVGTAWTQQRKFAPAAVVSQSGLHFGYAVALTGSAAAIGRDNLVAGGVDWFTKTGATYSTDSTSVTSTVPHFGSAVAMTDATTAIGSYADSSKALEAGAVFVTSTAAPHTPLVTLGATGGLATDHFGAALAIVGNSIFVGAPNNDSPQADSGSAYVFTSDGTTWSQQQKLVALSTISTDTLNAHYGSSIAWTANYGLIGSPSRADFVKNQGAVWSQEYALTNASPCSKGSECASGFCADGVCCDQICNSPCTACIAAFKASKVSGTCGVVPNNTDPHDACPNTGTTCGTSGLCNAAGYCAAAPTGTVCGTNTPICSTPTSSSVASACLATNICAQVPIPCNTGYACKGGACQTSCTTSADCDTANGFTCLSGGVCKKNAGAKCTADSDCITGTCGFGVCCVPIPPYNCATPPGALCATNDECFTHFCVDGVCCNSTCDGQCQACDLPGSQGICSPAKNDPGDPPGLCSPAAGSGGQAGSGGTAMGGNGGTEADGGAGLAGAGMGDDTGGANRGGTGGPVAIGGAGGASPSTAGSGGSVSGTAGAAQAGSAGEHDSGLGCVPACGQGLVCDEKTGACQDQLVTACGCRAAGGKGSTVPARSWFVLSVLAVAARRRSRHVKRDSDAARATTC